MSDRHTEDVSYLRMVLALPVALAAGMLLANAIVLKRLAEFIAGGEL